MSGEKFTPKTEKTGEKVSTKTKSAIGKAASSLRQMSTGEQAAGKQGSTSEQTTDKQNTASEQDLTNERARNRVSLTLPDEILMGDSGKYAYEQQQACEAKCQYLMDIVQSKRDDAGNIISHGVQPELEDFLPGGKHAVRRPYWLIQKDMEKLSARDGKPDRDEMVFWDRSLEVLPYAMAEYGAFGDPTDGRKAGPIWTSRFDDVLAGVDLGLSIPWTGRKKDGSEIKGRTDILIDVTASSSKKTIMQNKFRRHNDDRLPFMPEISAPIRYATDADGDVIGGWKRGTRFDDPERLRFVVGVDRGTMMDMLKGDKITTPAGRRKMEYMISRQIAEQALTKLQACTLLAKEAKQRGEMLDPATTQMWIDATRIHDHFMARCREMKGAEHRRFGLGGANDAQQIILNETLRINQTLRNKLV